MSATVSVTFGTLLLDSTNNITCKPPAERAAKSVQANNIPGMDGTIAEIAKLGAKTIMIEGDIAGSSYDDLRTNIDALKAGLLSQGLAKLTIDNERYIYCQAKDFSFSYIHLSRIADWSASFLAHFPFWLAEIATEDNRTPTSTVGYILNNAGNAPARVKLEITPTAEMADACKIENLTNGKSFQFRGTVAANKTLEVDNRYDTDDFQVLNDSVDAHVSFEGDFITLEPGNNTIIFTGTASTAVKLTYRKTWY